jgi:hypothetical protein
MEDTTFAESIYRGFSAYRYFLISLTPIGTFIGLLVLTAIPISAIYIAIQKKIEIEDMKKEIERRRKLGY